MDIMKNIQNVVTDYAGLVKCQPLLKLFAKIHDFPRPAILS